MLQVSATQVSQVGSSGAPTSQSSCSQLPPPPQSMPQICTARSTQTASHSTSQQNPSASHTDAAQVSQVGSSGAPASHSGCSQLLPGAHSRPQAATAASTQA